ncbi:MULTISPECIES: ThiF family adenylyltransferase [unclassified Novosphingobium]|uniref:ThiF family adenylyltransferase n=1 Tax=unclassified Novosphingobium TaxID=2644732 RepID=UPI00146A486D|nr:MULTISPECIES: ThiF family adenylyltransferase [unclassified Novosphingobium]NMN03802.1 molybdopterin/thiamine biosynthesis adenylyltransferase [Novosphingobium sp. SG919]NMN86209.1 molybdopterin/thiamine biosynthesis adenylyltransferase [Novosphingobium sp. SG916]
MTPEARLCADFDIARADGPVALTLTFPSFFPDTPPQITPRDGVRLSNHQYGAGGELCLEYRPDNWDPAFTGAMMIESAHRLLSGERPSPGATATVDNAHRTTVGQDVRGSFNRLLLPGDLVNVMGSLALHQPVELETSEHFSAGHWLAFVRRIGTKEEPIWNWDTKFAGLRKRTGIAVKIIPSVRNGVVATYDFFKTVVSTLKRPDLESLVASSQEEFAMLIECDTQISMMSLSSGSGNRAVFDYRTVVLPKDAPRIPAEYERLDRATVAIVGCGSVGSKIAATLARSGIGRFVLVDGDVLLPGNLVRNDLDWRSVGLNKPNAVSERIKTINPSAAVTVHRILLGGQESSASTDAALEAIGRSDLIVDATADAQVFNLCAAVARNERKVMVWGEVFAGGVGGLVARLRPDQEPVPHAARRQILAWCDDHGIDVPQGASDQYGLQLYEDLPPLIADDAEVSLIAGHMSRLAIDALVRDASIFPHAAYAIGLKAEWIFQAPFDTWPIDLVPLGEWGPQKDERLAEELEAFTSEFFPDLSEGDEG